MFWRTSPRFGIPVIGPLVVFLVFGHRSAFVLHHGAESLNFNITMLIALIASFILVFVLIGFLLLPIVGLLWLVLTILAAVAGSRGEWYRYPLTVRFVRYAGRALDRLR